MERTKLRLITITLTAIFLSILSSSAQSTKSIYEKSYQNAKARFEREKQTPLPDFHYHIEGSISYSGAYRLNNLSLNYNSMKGNFEKYIPEFLLRVLFINGSCQNRFGFELGANYISGYAINAKSTLLKAGISNGKYRELGGRFIYGNFSSLGYLSAISTIQSDTKIMGNSHGLYLSNYSSFLYQTDHDSAVGISFGINFYNLWNWHSRAKELETIKLRKPGFGIYPTIGLTYYLGGL